MAHTFVDVSAYKVFQYGGPNGNGGAVATVSLSIPNAWAFLRFFPDGSAIPENKKATHMSGKPIYYVHYRSAQLDSIIDVLRNEKPMKFFYRDDNKASYLTTANEPVGEGEG